jgi:hypothetical protein
LASDVARFPGENYRTAQTAKTPTYNAPRNFAFFSALSTKRCKNYNGEPRGSPLWFYVAPQSICFLA